MRSFTCSQRRASSSSPKMLRRGTTSTRPRMFSIMESRKTSGLPFSSSCRRSETRSTASPRAPVEIGHRVVQAFLDLVLDVALDAVGVAGSELRHEVVGVGDGHDPVADRELALERFLQGIVLDAEEPPEVHARLVDVIVVVLDEAGALAHNALAECVQQLGVTLVVSDGEKPRALVIPEPGRNGSSGQCSWWRSRRRRRPWAGGACCSVRRSRSPRGGRRHGCRRGRD